jgi:hypothetical protein
LPQVRRNFRPLAKTAAHGLSQGLQSFIVMHWFRGFAKIVFLSDAVFARSLLI